MASEVSTTITNPMLVQQATGLASPVASVAISMDSKGEPAAVVSPAEALKAAQINLSSMMAAPQIIVAQQPIVKDVSGLPIVVPKDSHPHRIEKYSHRQRKQGNEVHNAFKKPQEIFASAVNLGVYKAELRFDKTLILGFLAGAYIALAGCICIMFGGGVPTIKHDDPGLQKFLYACIFPFGIILCVICGAELVTSNMAVLPSALLAGRVSPYGVARNWFWAYFGNLCGALFVASLLLHQTDLAGTDPWKPFLHALVDKKVHGATWGQQVLRGIGCNWLVCLGFWSSLAAEDIIGKIFALWFPITAFVVIGFEHSVMNMFLIPAGIMTGAPNVTVGDFIGLNLIPVTIGNIIGGLLVAVPYWWVYWAPSHPLGLTKMIITSLGGKAPTEAGSVAGGSKAGDLEAPTADDGPTPYGAQTPASALYEAGSAVDSKK